MTNVSDTLGYRLLLKSRMANIEIAISRVGKLHPAGMLLVCKCKAYDALGSMDGWKIDIGEGLLRAEKTGVTVSRMITEDRIVLVNDKSQLQETMNRD